MLSEQLISILAEGFFPFSLPKNHRVLRQFEIAEDGLLVDID